MSHLIHENPSVVPETLYLIPVGNHERYWDRKPIIAKKVKETHKYIYVTIERNGYTSEPVRMRRDYIIDDSTGYGGYLAFPYLDWLEKELERREKMQQINHAWSRIAMGGGLSYEAVNAVHAALVADGYIEEDKA